MPNELPAGPDVRLDAATAPVSGWVTELLDAAIRVPCFLDIFERQTPGAYAALCQWAAARLFDVEERIVARNAGGDLRTAAVNIGLRSRIVVHL